MSSTGELLRKLQEGEGDEALRGLYALDGSEASLEKGRERAVRVVRAFEAEFGARPQAALFSGPGRTEIGGNHTDHQHGRVLCGSVDLDMLACAAPNGTDLVRIQSEGYPALEVDLRDLRVREEEKNSSPALVRGVAARLAELGCRPAGFDAYVTSTVLSGSGLSSSAAYEILVATIIDCFFGGGTLDPVERAKVGQYAENVYFGKPCGLMDQMGSSVAARWPLTSLTPPPLWCGRWTTTSPSLATPCALWTPAPAMPTSPTTTPKLPRKMALWPLTFGKQFLRTPENSPAGASSCGYAAAIVPGCGRSTYDDDRRAVEEADASEAGDFDRFLVSECLRHLLLPVSAEHLVHRRPQAAGHPHGSWPSAGSCWRALALSGSTAAACWHHPGLFVPVEKLTAFGSGAEKSLGTA